MQILFLCHTFCIVASLVAALDVPKQDESLNPFSLVGSSGVPAMHAAVIPPDGKVVFLDKVETFTELQFPNGQWAYSAIYDPNTHHVKALSVATNPFCCGGTFSADGRLLTFGGNAPLLWLDPTVEDGFDAIRYLENDDGERS
jgi:hypothetical protein